MNYLSYKTVSVNKENANKKWYVVDAEGQILGRLASQVAMILRGKRKACFTPHSDCGDNVIIINAEKVVQCRESGPDWKQNDTEVLHALHRLSGWPTYKNRC